MSKWIVDIHGNIEGDYEIIEEYEEPKTGHWIGKGDFITCSCCNEMSYPFDSAGYGSIYHYYCPNCGAKMAESEEK